MSFSSSKKHRKTLAIAQKIVVALLLLGSFSNVASLRELTNAPQVCTMECCAGKAQHLAGECSMEADLSSPSCPAHLSTEPHLGATVRNEDELHSNAIHLSAAATHKHELWRHVATTEKDATRNSLLITSVLFEYAQDAAAKHAKENRFSSQQSLRFASSSSLSVPCQPSCGAGAVSFSQGQRGANKSAAPGAAVRPRPPTSAASSQHLRPLAFAEAAWLEVSHPRGPPALFS